MLFEKRLQIKKICLTFFQGKKGRIFILELILLVTIFYLPGQAGLGALLCGQAVPEAAQAGEVLRFHVRAHSNSPHDQEIKNYLAREILARFQAEWSSCRNSGELERLLAENSAALAGAAREILQEQGVEHDVETSLTRDLFPARFYEGKLYPPGEYTALYLVIGEGRGENWWCVLFPPLCFNLLPPLAADADTDAAGAAGPESRLAAADTGSGSGASAARAAETGGQCEWRFWLWEKLCKIIGKAEPG